MRWVRTILLVLAAIVMAALLIGATRPADHVANISFRLAASDTVVWSVVSDFEQVPKWFPLVRSVERIADVDGQPTYREDYDGFPATVVVRETIPLRRVVREVMPSGSFSGSWTLELAPANDSTRITITERGHVGNPFVRTLMIFYDNTATLREYATALGTKLGTPPAIDNVTSR